MNALLKVSAKLNVNAVSENSCLLQAFKPRSCREDYWTDAKLGFQFHMRERESERERERGSLMKNKMDAVWKADCGIINCFQFPPSYNDREISSGSWGSVFYWSDYLLFVLLMCMCVQNSEAVRNGSSVIRAHINSIVSVSHTLTLFVFFHWKCLLCGLCRVTLMPN